MNVILYKQLTARAALTIESVVNIISCCEGEAEGMCPLDPPISAGVAWWYYSQQLQFVKNESSRSYGVL